MGSMVGAMQPAIREDAMQMNQHAFNQQLGRGASNQMYEPSPGQYDPYTASRRPNYMPYGPNQQFYQPIYQPRYEQQFRTMDQMYQMPTYTRPLTPQPTQQQYTPTSTQQTQANSVGFKGFRNIGKQQPNNFPYSLNYNAPLTPQPMQSQYRPIPFMNQTQIDAKAQAQAAADAAASAAATHMPSFSGDGAKAGGKVHGEGIDSLLRK